MSDERERALTQVHGGLLRAVEGEARRRERIRVADAIRHRLTVAEQHDRRSVGGRVRYGLEAALAVVPEPDYSDGGSWDELAGSVTGELDGIDVGLYTQPADGEPEPWPFRVKVVDGADDTVAYAYLTDAEVAELIDLLQHARKRYRQLVVHTPLALPAGDVDGG